MNARRPIAPLAAVAALLAACADTGRPLEPVWGKQPCSHCAMVLSDERFGAQLVTDSGDRLYFDDVGCLVLFLEDGRVRPLRSWVRDARTHRWLDARAATYAPGAASPMDFGFEAREGGALPYDEMRVRVLARRGGER